MLFNSGRLIFCSLLLLKIPRRISWGFVFHWKRSRRAANRLKIGASRLTLIVGKGDFAFQQSPFSVEDCQNCKNMSSVKIWELQDFSNSSCLTLILFIFHSFLKFGWISWVILFLVLVWNWVTIFVDTLILPHFEKFLFKFSKSTPMFGKIYLDSFQNFLNCVKTCQIFRTHFFPFEYLPY